MNWNRRRPQRRTASGRIVATYNYTDERGKLLYQVRRHQPKGFSVHSAKGQTIGPDNRYRRVPYRLPELLAADPAQIVFVAEGEKDVDRLRSEGLIATCNAFGGGKGKWTRGHSRYLHNRHVVILPDNDRTGAEHGLSVAKALYRVAATVRVVNLPNLPHKGDVSDWLDMGHTAAELLKMVEAAPRWRPGRGGDQLPEPDWREKWERDYDGMCHARWIRQAVYGLPVPATEKLLLVMLSEYKAPLQEDVAMYLGVSARRVGQMVKHLTDQGVLSVQKSGRRNRYYIQTKMPTPPLPLP